MGFFDTVKDKAGALAADTQRAGKVTAAQARLVVLQNDLKKAERELGHAAFALAERGELDHPDLAHAVERLRATSAEVRAKEAEIAALRGEAPQQPEATAPVAAPAGPPRSGGRRTGHRHGGRTGRDAGRRPRTGSGDPGAAGRRRRSPKPAREDRSQSGCPQARGQEAGRARRPPRRRHPRRRPPAAPQPVVLPRRRGASPRQGPLPRSRHGRRHPARAQPARSDRPAA